MAAVEGFRGFPVVQAPADHVVLLILADDAGTVDRLATGSPWMRAHVVPLLAVRRNGTSAR